ncbi:MAG: D-2-hydroxyacid dehydrogenase [Chloroflexi bacterium]|nr:D-2-hydroxyacid dehydrogenase [Chloroflexota bacterium]
MTKVNVLVVSKTFSYDGFLKDVEAVDPRVIARDATGLFVQELQRNGVTDPSMARFEQVLQRDSAYGADPRTGGKSLDSLLNAAEVIFASHMYPQNMMSRSPRLKWCHFGGTGIDRYVDSEVFDGRIIVTNSRGVGAISVAEHVMAFIFSLAKGIGRLYQAKAERRWERFDTIELAGKTLGVIGMGAIGSQVATMAKGLGMKVIATRRSATRAQRGVGDVDKVYPRDALLEMLAESDFLALALPLTEGSRKLLGEQELRAMKPTAFIVNTSRGPLIDERALIRALREGWIAGAGLDVFDEEPLGRESELWAMSNVILSPHMAGCTDRRGFRVSRLFCENLKRYVSGQPLLNVVTREKGY